MKKISILGVSGSIGQQAIDVIREYPDLFELVGVSVGCNIDYLNKIITEFPTITNVAIANKNDLDKVVNNEKINVFFGEEGMNTIATLLEIDTLLVAVVGFRGLVPTINAIKNNKVIALANKETMVCAGEIINSLLKEYKGRLIPVDSEHSAIFQALNGENKQNIKNLIITASGGSFRDKERYELENVTLKEALNHPNWSMGSSITIDSATMFNKGLEIIEAHYLFNIDYDNIKVLIHPESIIHSIVEFNDNSQIAQLSEPDMRLPIQYAFTYPDRKKMNIKELCLEEIGKLTFKKADFNRYPALEIAYNCGRKGHSYPTVLNAAKEQAVQLFLEEKISFLMIETIVEQMVDTHEIIIDPSIEQLVNLDYEIKENVKKRWEH